MRSTCHLHAQEKHRNLQSDPNIHAIDKAKVGRKDPQMFVRRSEKLKTLQKSKFKNNNNNNDNNNSNNNNDNNINKHVSEKTST